MGNLLCVFCWPPSVLVNTPIRPSLSISKTLLGVVETFFTKILKIRGAGTGPVRQVQRTPNQCLRQKVEINAHVRGILIRLQRRRPLKHVRRLLPAPI